MNESPNNVTHIAGEPVEEMELSALIRHCADEFDRIDEERGMLNDEKSKLRKELKSRGIRPKAFEHTVKLRRIEDGKLRDQYDYSMLQCRRALGLPVDLDLVDQMNGEEVPER